MLGCAKTGLYRLERCRKLRERGIGNGKNERAMGHGL